MLVYSRVDDPRQTFSSASSTCRDKASGSVYTTTGVSPSSRHERATLRAISPRFAIRTLALPGEVRQSISALEGQVLGDQKQTLESTAQQPIKPALSQSKR